MVTYLDSYTVLLPLTFCASPKRMAAGQQCHHPAGANLSPLTSQIDLFENVSTCMARRTVLEGGVGKSEVANLPRKMLISVDQYNEKQQANKHAFST